jgi:flagellar hook-associated protein 1 FlgK
MSFQALNAALSGLRVAQQQLTVISNNVSNATTPGYTRKILPQSTQVVNSTGQIIGVQSETMIRKVDMNLEKELWTQVSGVAQLDVTASYLDRIEKFHGATQEQRSIAAEISQLKDTFAALSDSPSDGFLQQSTLAQAQTVATKFNQFGALISDMRNDAQDEMSQTVDRINDLLSSIAELNKQIKGAANLNRSTAGIEDHRDEAIKELSSLIGISSFTRGDGVIVVQTTAGVQLADERAAEVFFDPNVIGPTTTYPSSVSGVFVGGNPLSIPTAFDITATDVGGKLGGLIDLRDNTLVQYQAQVDELAHKLALRLEAQGLLLFTDPTGVVPSDAPPDISVNPPTSVAYVGFASVIQVNPDVVNNIALIQQGTYTSDLNIPTASNEVIRRVIEFGFGDVNYQEVTGTTDLNVALPATDLQQWLGLYSTNNVVGGIDFSSFNQIDDAAPGGNDIADQLEDYFPNWPADAQFQITFEEARLGLGPTTVNVDLAAIGTDPAYAIGNPGINNALDQIVAGINAAITAAAVPAGLAAVATTNTNGQLVIRSRGNVTYDASSFAGSMGASAFGALGLNERTYTTEDPYFDIQVGSGEMVRVTIEPADTVADLVAKLEYNPATGTGVPGLYVDYNAGTGTISLRPGMDDTNGGPRFGGDLKIIAGPGTTNGAINAAIAALPSGVGVVSAIFGSYSVSGPTVTQNSPVTDVAYRSETYLGSGVFVPFRRDYLGPGADRSTGILTGGKIIDFGQKMVNAQAQDLIVNATKQADTTSLRDLLQERHLNETGVNIDEELSTLIVIQTAYAAAARAVTAADEMFTELLNAI